MALFSIFARASEGIQNFLAAPEDKIEIKSLEAVEALSVNTLRSEYGMSHVEATILIKAYPNRHDLEQSISGMSAEFDMSRPDAIEILVQWACEHCIDVDEVRWQEHAKAS